MKYYCDDYYQMLNNRDKEWIELIIIYLLENNFRKVGAFNNLENYFDEVTRQKYIDVKNRLLKYKKSNFEHKARMCDWRFERYGGTCGGMLDLIIQLRKLLKLFEVYKNQGLFEEIKNKNLKNISCSFYKNLLKLYMINGEFNFDYFIDLIYLGNRKFANVLNECFDLNLSNDELNFYG